MLNIIYGLIKTNLINESKDLAFSIDKIKIKLKYRKLILLNIEQLKKEI